MPLFTTKWWEETMKRFIKNQSINLFQKYLSHDSATGVFSERVRANTQRIGVNKNIPSPYYSYKSENVTSLRDDIVFITGRFRSGSSVFWNVFRAQNDCTAYYEPFNERRWFDVKHRGSFVDNSHKGIDDYWSEYDKLEHLSNLYNEKWINTALHMDENSCDINMHAFINSLIENAKGRPVLQFNRIDFRLPWLRKHYPNAKFLHIYRNPRDQWLSFLTDKQKMNALGVQNTYKDAFYLDVWCKDLSQQFPFLSPKITPHPYMRFYYLWKLSYLYGTKYCDYSVALEELMSSPQQTLCKIKSLLNWNSFDTENSAQVVHHLAGNKWVGYAEEKWFEQKEAECELELDNYFGSWK